MDRININQIVINYLDIKERKIAFSKNIIPDENTVNYVYKKVENVLRSPSMKEIIVGQQNQLLNEARKAFNNTDQFISTSTYFTECFFNMGISMDVSPNSYVFCIDAIINDSNYFLALKVDCQSILYPKMMDGSIELVNQQIMPLSAKKVDEAIIINDHQIFIIEKKYEIDGKNQFYLNPYWIKGQC